MLTTVTDTVDGKRVRLARLGTGPPLVLLHGYPDTLQIWSRLAPLLAAQFEVIAFDWPGMGGSEAWSGGATPLHLAQRLVRLLDHWGIDRAFIAGHDMGGQPALVAAAEHSTRTRGVIVMNSLVIGSEDTSWEIAILRKFRANELLLRHLPRLVFTRAVRTSLREPLPPDVRDELWREFAKRPAREFIIRMCAGYQGTLDRLPALYQRITVPALILWGENDRHFPPAQAARLHELMPHAELRLLSRAEHWMVWSHAEDVAGAMIEWRDSHV